MFATDSSCCGIAYLILSNTENQSLLLSKLNVEEENLFFASIFMPQ